MSSSYKTSQGDTLDFICWKIYGQQSGAVEAVLLANPGLADLGEVLPVNTTVILPELEDPVTEIQPIRLWS
jgi:phage tail protein X